MAYRKLIGSAHPGVAVSLIPRSRYPEVTSFVLQNFLSAELLSSTFKLADTDMCKKIIERHLLMELEHDLSFMAVDTTTNQLVGAQVNHEYTTDLMAARIEDTEKLSQVHSGWRTYSTAIAHQLFTKNVTDIISQNRTFHHHMATVLPSYGGKGIFRSLFDLSQERSVERKYDVVFGMPSTDTSRRAFQRIGCKLMGCFYLKDVIHEGKPAAPPTSTDRMEIYVKLPSPKNGS